MLNKARVSWGSDSPVPVPEGQSYSRRQWEQKLLKIFRKISEGSSIMDTISDDYVGCDAESECKTEEYLRGGETEKDMIF
jgi:hypothetical protein